MKKADIEIDELALSLQRRWDDGVATRLLELLKEVVSYHAQRIGICGMDKEDICQELRITLFGKCLSQYDPSKGHFGPRYETYCRWRLSQLYEKSRRTNNTMAALRLEELACDDTGQRDHARRRDMSEAADKWLDRANPLYRRIVRMRCDGMTYDEVGQAIGVSGERIRQRMATVTQGARRVMDAACG